jgi:hypothetical protein
MKDALIELVRQAPTPVDGRNLAREYLQARLLAALQRQGAMIPLAFHGGTALRFLYGHGRFSEDLDFALEGDRQRYDFRGYLNGIRGELSAERYDLEMKVNDRKTVHSAFVRFPGLLYELGLSGLRSQALSVKLEVDTNPPGGAGLATSLVRHFFILQLQHHDKASLLSGKLHAILQRPYAKGRDIYDLLWYLSDPAWPSPNLVLLNNALAQTGWTGGRLTERNWRELVHARLRSLDWRDILADVRPFIEPGFDLDLLTLANLERALRPGGYLQAEGRRGGGYRESD